jgi:hypothetical protein
MFWKLHLYHYQVKSCGDTITVVTDSKYYFKLQMSLLLLPDPTQQESLHIFT